jgi:LuxR family maltose regulon positive regulatory protein
MGRYNGALGLLSIFQGDLFQLKDVAEKGFNLLNKIDNETALASIYFHLFNCYHRNELTNLEEYWHLAYEKRYKLRPFYYVQCAVIWSFIELSHGNADKAMETLKETLEFLKSNIRSADGISFLEAAKVEIALRSGNLHLAEALAQGVDFNFRYPGWEFLSPLITRFKLVQFLGDGNEANAMLREMTKIAKKSNHRYFLLNTLVTQGHYYWTRREKEKAFISLDKALKIAEPNGFVRIFLDYGPALKDLLKEYAMEYGEKRYATRILKDIEKESSRFGSIRNQFIDSSLTLREKQIIHQVRQGFRNKEIAEILFISESTVKKHLSNIFKKMRVKSRQELIISF